jgi:hypothetical protein
MNPELQKRLVKVSQTIDRLEQIKHIVEQSEGTSLRRQVASAAVVAAEYIAAVTGNEEETGIIHRAYEEIFAAIENSPAVAEMIQWDRVSEQRVASVHGHANRALEQFRLRLANGAGDS